MPARLSRYALPVLALLLLSSAGLGASPEQFFAIKVVDADTGRGVPLVELKTTHNVSYYTDSNGLVAIGDPELMGQSVFFTVRSHGYEFAKDGFGFAGKALDVKAGGRAELKIKRLNIAERLYRVTGAGIYRDSVLLGEPVPVRQPLLNGQVTGQDSVQRVIFQGKVHWFWGDTNRLRYPLGLFAMAGATTPLPGPELDPAKGIDLKYYVNKEGFCRATAPMDEPGLVWIDGIAVVPNENGRQVMICHYSRMKSLHLRLEHGLMVWDEKAEVFRKRVQFDLKQPWRTTQGHPVRWKDGEVEYLLFPTPFANVRARADLKSLLDPASYEAFTCLAPGTQYKKGEAKVERDAGGKLVYAWKPNTDPVSVKEEKELIADGKIKLEEAWYQPRDVDGDKPVQMHGGSIAWNEYRKKWIMIAVEIGGTSMLGEVWLSEADSPLGPWHRAKKIVTHDKYDFYNPAHHPFLDQDGGRTIYFEGTYVNTFSGNPVATPLYDYNQVMYRLDLGDPRLAIER